jgi:hypothetical protein
MEQYILQLQQLVETAEASERDANDKRGGEKFSFKYPEIYKAG